jgi:hypothetical protein
LKASDFFIDWIDLRQNHAATHLFRQTGTPYPGHPEFIGGVRATGDEIVAQSEDGKVFYLLSAAVDSKRGFKTLPGRREGSFSTSVLLHSDGSNVRISGNVGRLDRPDNIWNYDFADTITLANIECRRQGLPAFTTGDQILRDTISEDDRRKGVSPWKWTGAAVNELHVTRNWYAGSDPLAIETMRDMQGRRLARVSKSAFGNESVSFGMPNKKGQRLHRGVVCYRKGPEMLAHAKGEEAKQRVRQSDEYQLAMDTGLVRVELKCGALFLRGHNLRYLGDIQMSKLIALYNHETAPLLLARPDNSVRLVADMPRPLRMSALSWIDGRDLRTLLSPATFKRHRKALMSFGLDVSEPRRIDGRPNAEEALQRLLDALPQHSLQPMTAPDWYGLPDVERRAA